VCQRHGCAVLLGVCHLFMLVCHERLRQQHTRIETRTAAQNYALVSTAHMLNESCIFKFKQWLGLKNPHEVKQES
jgi:hypothetical protein